MAAFEVRGGKTLRGEITPQGANLVLTSTIVGPVSQVARINGKNYRNGAKIGLRTKDGQSLVFTIAEIQARNVVLERLGKQYELKIQAPKSSGTIEMVGSVQ